MSVPENRTAARILFALAWLLGAGAALLANAGEPALAWFVGITAVVLVAGAVTMAAAAAADEAEAEQAEIIVRRRTVTRHETTEVTPTRDDEEIRP